MYAFFQSSGKMPLVRDLLYKRDRGIEIDSAEFLISSVGQPSGPGDLPLFKLASLLNTNCGVMTSVSIVDGGTSVWGVGIELSPQVKTLEK